VAGGLDALQVELLDLLDVVEDRRQLAGHALDLLVGEAQPRELGHVKDLVAADHLITSSSEVIAVCRFAVAVILKT
jgi:hypothetical protein